MLFYTFIISLPPIRKFTYILICKYTIFFYTATFYSQLLAGKISFFLFRCAHMLLIVLFIHCYPISTLQKKVPTIRSGPYSANKRIFISKIFLFLSMLLLLFEFLFLYCLFHPALKLFSFPNLLFGFAFFLCHHSMIHALFSI